MALRCIKTLAIVVANRYPANRSRPSTDESAHTMHPALIQAALKMRGVTQADIARACEVSGPMVHDVIHGNRRSQKVENRIAAASGFAPAELWPTWYDAKTNQRRRRAVSTAQVSALLRAVG